MLELLDQHSSRYFSAAMKTVIEQRSVVLQSKYGYGLFARENIAKDNTVGYYSGPVLTWNNIEKYKDQDDYVAGGQFRHPKSGKAMSYHVLVTGQTRYMNHGHNPNYYKNQPQHSMVANSEMQYEKMRRIGRIYRPIWEFKALRDIAKNEELLYDYGVHEDEIYYEILRRNHVRDSNSRRRQYKKTITALTGQYKNRLDSLPPKKQFESAHGHSCIMKKLLINFLNSPDRYTHPTYQMIIAKEND